MSNSGRSSQLLLFSGDPNTSAEKAKGSAPRGIIADAALPEAESRLEDAASGSTSANSISRLEASGCKADWTPAPA